MHIIATKEISKSQILQGFVLRIKSLEGKDRDNYKLLLRRQDSSRSSKLLSPSRINCQCKVEFRYEPIFNKFVLENNENVENLASDFQMKIKEARPTVPGIFGKDISKKNLLKKKSNFNQI